MVPVGRDARGVHLRGQLRVEGQHADRAQPRLAPRVAYVRAVQQRLARLADAHVSGPVEQPAGQPVLRRGRPDDLPVGRQGFGTTASTRRGDETQLGGVRDDDPHDAVVLAGGDEVALDPLTVHHAGRGRVRQVDRGDVRHRLYTPVGQVRARPEDWAAHEDVVVRSPAAEARVQQHGTVLDQQQLAGSGACRQRQAAHLDRLRAGHVDDTQHVAVDENDPLPVGLGQVGLVDACLLHVGARLAVAHSLQWRGVLHSRNDAGLGGHHQGRGSRAWAHAPGSDLFEGGVHVPGPQFGAVGEAGQLLGHSPFGPGLCHHRQRSQPQGDHRRHHAAPARNPRPQPRPRHDASRPRSGLGRNDTSPGSLGRWIVSWFVPAPSAGSSRDRPVPAHPTASGPVPGRRRRGRTRRAPGTGRRGWQGPALHPNHLE